MEGVGEQHSVEHLPLEAREIARKIAAGPPVAIRLAKHSLYANAEGYEARRRTDSTHLLDRYVLAKTRELVESATARMDAYDVSGACAEVRSYLDVLTNWYVRRSRDRFWSGDPDAFDTLYEEGAKAPKMMSIGLLVKERDPLMWRGPMIHSFIQQMLKDVQWGPLDYLLFDMPPGTGDAQISLSQVIPLTGVVMVTTPQDVALLDVRKALGMFQRLNVPILGIVENMSYFTAPNGERIEIFGHGGGRAEAARQKIPFLGEIPIFTEIRLGGDNGVPVVVSHPDQPFGQAFIGVAASLSERLG